MRKREKSPFTSMGWAVVFGVLIYAIIVFALCGFNFEHGPAFWCGFVFMLFAVAAVGICFRGLKSKITGQFNMEFRDMIFNKPLKTHFITYIVIELIVSSAFMLLDEQFEAVTWPLVIQLLVFFFFLIVILTGFHVKERVETVYTVNTKNVTRYIKVLEAEAKGAAAAATDAKIRGAFEELAEEIRRSDPVSDPKVFSLEKQISKEIKAGEKYSDKDKNEKALEHCTNAMALLKERNAKVKAYK